MNYKYLLPALAWTVFAASVSAQPVIDDANSRAFTVDNLVSPGPPATIGDAHSRAFTVDNLQAAGPPLAIGDAHSRAFTVNNLVAPGPPSTIGDAHSRAFTVQNLVPPGPPLSIADAHSRAFTVANVIPPGPPLAIADAHSRAFTILNCTSCVSDASTCDALPDCNQNGINDICEMLTGIMPDCNGNGIPDDCEITPCATCLGDVNGDGAANGGDVQPFVDILLMGGSSDCGDIDLSGGPLDTTDLNEFICRLLSAPPACLP